MGETSPAGFCGVGGGSVVQRRAAADAGEGCDVNFKRISASDVHDPRHLTWRQREQLERARRVPEHGQAPDG